MASPFLSRNDVVLTKIEVTYGTDPTPVVATDAVLTQIPSDSDDVNVLDRNVTSGTLSPLQPIIGRKLSNASMDIEFKSEIDAAVGSSGDPIEIDAILRAAGFNPTYTAETSGGANDGDVQYDLVSTAFESITTYLYFQDVLKKITGAFCDLSWSFVAGDLPVMSASMIGKYNATTDATATTPTYAPEKPVMVESATLTLDALAPVCRSISIAMNNNIIERPDVNSAEGLIGVRIADRNPTATIVVEEPLVATKDFWALLDAATALDVDFNQGSGAGGAIAVSIPKLALTNVTRSDDNGIVVVTLEGVCSKTLDAGDDELQFIFS